MSSLTEMWEVQEDFYKKVRCDKRKMTDHEFAHSLVLHLHSEGSELLDAVGGPWKTHSSNYEETKKSQVLSEVVDIIKIAMEVSMIYGSTPAEFYDMFMLKSEIVNERRKGEKFLREGPTNPVVFDFDGVLAAYPKPFLEFLAAELGRPMSCNGPDDIWMSLGIPLWQYEELKKKYWESEWPARAAEVYPAVSLIKELSDGGIPVVVVTSRDRNYLESAEHSTYQWLFDHFINVDGVYFTSDKARFIKKHFPDAIVAIDDNEVEAARIKKAGINSVLVNSTYAPDYDAFVFIAEFIKSKLD